jgi:hypothetical protein
MKRGASISFLQESFSDFIQRKRMKTPLVGAPGGKTLRTGSAAQN